MQVLSALNKDQIEKPLIGKDSQEPWTSRNH